MSNRLITTSLLDSIAWAKNAPSKPTKDDPNTTWAQRAYEDLKKTLGRVSWEPDKWLKRGIEFENKVYSLTQQGVDPDIFDCSPKFRFFLQEARGAGLWRKSKSFMQVDKEEYCVFGKMDLWFKDKIKDIKTTKNYGGKDKYLATMQHKIYCLNEKIQDFEYLIAEFSDDPEDMAIKETYRVPYHITTFADIREEVTYRIHDSIEFLQQFEGEGDLWDLYLNKYCYKW